MVELPELRPPARAAAHHEDPHRRVVERLAVLAEVRVEEAQLLGEVPVDAPHRVRPEVDVERPARVAAHADVAPRADDQPLRRRVLLRHRGEVLGVRVRKAVVPAGRERAGHVRVPVVVGREVVRLLRPVVVVRAARRVVEERLLERRRVAQRELALPEGELPEELAEMLEVLPDLELLVPVARDVLRVLRVDEERPEHVELHRAALARLVLEGVGRDDVRPDRGEVRRALEGRADLRDPRVRRADGADAPVRPRLGRDPLDRVVAVLALLTRDGVEVVAGAVASVPIAQVLEAHRVPVRDEEVGDLGVALVRAVVGRAAEDRRKASLGPVALARGPVDVRRELDPVARPHAHVLRQHDPVAHASSLSTIRFAVSSTRTEKPGWTIVVESSSSTTTGPTSRARPGSALRSWIAQST